jgi:hypothetical protein
MTRILVAQGPSQLISALAVWHYLAAEPQVPCDDILVLGNFCVPDKIARELERCCREVARSWPFRKIIPTRLWDAALDSGKINFDTYTRRLVAEAGSADVVFVCRNMQALNEAALYAWPDAKKVCYGDWGMIDLNGAPWSKPMKSSGYPQVDCIMTHAPVERNPGLFDHIPLTLVPLEFFLKAWNNASAAVWGIDALSRELSKNCGEKKILVCPTNFTESGNVCSVEEELQFHEACLAPYRQTSCTVFIKGHPRETMNQSARLTARLQSKGHDARCFPAYNTMPVDLFARCLKVDLMLSLFSYSGVVWRLVQPETDILFGVSQELVQKFVRPEATAMFHYDDVMGLYFLLAIMATRREYRPLRMQTLRPILREAPRAPIFLSGHRAGAAMDPAAMAFYELAMKTVGPTKSK